MKIQKLGTLQPGQSGIIKEVHIQQDSRLLQLGFIKGSQIQVMHEAPFFKDPIAVLVRGTIIALRRNEANAVEVEVI